MSLIVVALGLTGMYFAGLKDGSQDRYEYKTRIEPSEITINQQTGDTTFVYIME